MIIRWLISLSFAIAMMAAAAGAKEITIVRNVLGPEGPLFVDGNLYFVAWTSSTLSKWDGKTATVINRTAGCGHNGLALTKQKTFLLACDDVHGAIIELDLTGKELRRWDLDSKGAKLDGGINDIVVTANGGAYATLSGPFVDPPVEVMGKVLYLAPGAKDWIAVADDFNYANGVAISRDQKTLYVAETVGNRIYKFAVNADGTLSHRANFAALNLLTESRVKSWWLGPDSMKTDAKGDLYVAQLYGGKILKLSPSGKLLHTFKIAAGVGTTNLAFGPGEKDLYVSVVEDLADPKAPGRIVKIPNVR